MYCTETKLGPWRKKTTRKSGFYRASEGKYPHLHVVSNTGYQQVCVHIYKQQEEMFSSCDVLENCEAFSSILITADKEELN